MEMLFAVVNLRCRHTVTLPKEAKGGEAALGA